MTPFLTGPLPCPHGFFTRDGGVSTGELATLNTSGTGDDPANIVENRARALASLGAGAALAMVRQVHGARVLTVVGALDTADADAMVTTRPDVILGIVTADCAPVLFSNRSGTVVGAAHAGWRGAVSGVLEATVAAMADLGAADVAAVIGPCIQQPSYEVGPDLRDAALAATPHARNLFAPGEHDRFWFDLPGYCALRLSEVGIAVTSLGVDTVSDPRFFSNRRRTRAVAADGVARPLGHQIAMITRC